MYWDTSAILKIYMAEPDSDSFEALLARDRGNVTTSAITPVEILCALCRKEQEGNLKRGAAQVLFDKYADDAEKGRIVEIPYGRAITREAEAVVRRAAARRNAILIRSLDAIHVASAIAGRMKSIVTTDRRLRECARFMHLRVVP